MSERVCPFRAKPTQAVRDHLAALRELTMFVVQRLGPTSFLVREEGSEVKRRVRIGASPSCTCQPSSARGPPSELCVHMLFVLVRVLRVPESNPIVWQLSLIDRELDEVLRCAEAPRVQSRAPPAAVAATPDEPALAPGEVARRTIEPDESCPICYECLDAAPLADVVHCRWGCGRNVHGRCMRVWADHQASLGKELSCPLCRNDWGDFTWKPTFRPPAVHARVPRHERDPASHYGVVCGGCRESPLTGPRHRCVVCASFNLCSSCFARGAHPQHPFVVQSMPGDSEQPAERDLLAPTSPAPASLAPARPDGDAGSGEAGAELGGLRERGARGAGGDGNGDASRADASPSIHGRSTEGAPRRGRRAASAAGSGAGQGRPRVGGGPGTVDVWEGMAVRGTRAGAGRADQGDQGDAGGVRPGTEGEFYRTASASGPHPLPAKVASAGRRRGAVSRPWGQAAESPGDRDLAGLLSVAPHGLLRATSGLTVRAEGDEVARGGVTRRTSVGAGASRGSLRQGSRSSSRRAADFDLGLLGSATGAGPDALAVGGVGLGP